MKLLLGITIVMAIGISCYAIDKIKSVKIGTEEYTDISDVHVGSDGMIVIKFPSGVAVESPAKLPVPFLESWGIDSVTLAEAKATGERTAAESLERAIRAGSFREVDGIVYDIRKPQSGWVTVANAKVIQILKEGTIVDASPSKATVSAAFIKNLPKTVADTDTVTISAKVTGTYSYLNKLNDKRTIRAYDVGRVCRREEIPASVLEGRKPYDTLVTEGTPNRDVLATLPESNSLKATGSGFFITEDGFLITNYHVVRGAKRLSVKTAAGVTQAKIVATDVEHDLALLKATIQSKPLPVADNMAQLGESVFTIGFPNVDLQGTEPKFTDGKISSLAGIKDDPKEYQISVPVQPGNSGGPLVNKAGKVVGVVVSRLDDLTTLTTSGSLPQNVNYAIKGNFVRELVKRQPAVALREHEDVKQDELAGFVQQSVVMVLVY
jgi:S1-C subfamily serine protease